MTTGAKVAIGCVVAVGLAGVAALVAIGAGAWWMKGKVEEVAGPVAERTREIERYERKANANHFTEPADAVIPEPRLLKFIEVRKAVYAVYEAHRPEFERMSDQKDASISDVMKLGGVFLDVKVALSKGLAEVGMSEDEYHFIVRQVYESEWLSTAQDEAGESDDERVTIPKANRDLFKKHEADLKKYAMEGLALAGL